MHSSASTSNPPLFLAPFGLPPCIPLLQRPIRHAASSLLDFLRVFLCFNVQSTTLFRSFWTSSVHSSASTSNPPLIFFPFGLSPCIPPLQRPIHHAASSLLDFLCAFLCFNIQSTTQFLPFWTFACLSTTSTSNPNLYAHIFFHRKYFNC